MNSRIITISVLAKFLRLLLNVEWKLYILVNFMMNKFCYNIEKNYVSQEGSKQSKVMENKNTHVFQLRILRQMTV